jgi:hypothetical protein
MRDVDRGADLVRAGDHEHRDGAGVVGGEVDDVNGGGKV